MLIINHFMTKNSNKIEKDFSFDTLDKTPISKLLTFSAEDLFKIQEQASIAFEKANYRKKWIDGVIDLKYKATIESSYKKALNYFNSEPLQEMDKYNDDLIQYLEDDGSIIKVEFYRGLSELSERPQIKKRFSLIKLKEMQNDKEQNNQSKSQSQNETSNQQNQSIKIIKRD